MEYEFTKVLILIAAGVGFGFLLYKVLKKKGKVE